MQSFQMALEERFLRILDILIELTQKMRRRANPTGENWPYWNVTEEDALAAGHL